jgi:hypothetical protein
MTGQPGAGKSSVVKIIMHVAAIMKAGHLAGTSYNGIAAVNIHGGTICNMFDLKTNYDTKIWNQAVQAFKCRGDKLSKIRQNLHWENLHTLVIDEVSTIDAFTIALLDLRLRDVMDQPLKPFGGVAVLMCGDFDQLGPVGKHFIPTDMVNWAMHHRLSKNKCFDNSPYRTGTMLHRGCSLFADFNRTHLLCQQRSDDIWHNNNILRMSNGKTIDIQDLDIYDDFASSKNSKDQDWDFPTFIVASNQERMDIIRVQAQKWALKHKTYVIKWKNKVTKWANKPTGRDLEKAFQNNNFMWQYFVKDAPAFIKQNINTNLGLANGTEATQHSLTFCDDHQSKQLEEILSGPNPPPYGTEIELDAPPYSVNLEIKFSKEESFLSHVQKQQRLLLKNTLSLTQDIRQSSLSQKIQGEEKTPRDTTYCQLHKTSHYPMQIFCLTFQLHWALLLQSTCHRDEQFQK